MLNLIVNKIKTNIAQHTELFDLETTTTTCTTVNNTLTVVGLSGEYVLSGGIDGIASKGCFNQLLDFVGGVARVECFFGEDEEIHDIKTHLVNVGQALKRQFAIEIIVDDKIENIIIAYWESTQTTQTDYKYSISADNHVVLHQKFGVLFKINIAEMHALGGCDILDKTVINSVITSVVNLEHEDTTLVRFDSIKDRFFAGNYYCVDLGFSYLEEIGINDIIRDRVKHFDAELEEVKIHEED